MPKYLASLMLVLLFALPALADRKVQAVSDEVREQFGLDPFYEKILNADGLLFVGSEKVPDEAFQEAAYLIDQMLMGRDDLREAIAKLEIRLAIMSHDEYTTDVPEDRHLATDKGGKGKDFWDRRARGMGAYKGFRDAMTCGVENLLQYKGDPYHDENIIIHEFAHVIDDVALAEVDKTFEDRLWKTYKQAMDDGLWKDAYASVNRAEYWAEIVQVWFECNPPKARHDHIDINTREELIEYDPRAVKLLKEVFGDNDYKYTFPKDRKDKAHLAKWDFDKAPVFEWPERLKNINVRQKPKPQDGQKKPTSISHSCPTCEAKRLEAK